MLKDKNHSLSSVLRHFLNLKFNFFLKIYKFATDTNSFQLVMLGPAWLDSSCTSSSCETLTKWKVVQLEWKHKACKFRGNSFKLNVYFLLFLSLKFALITQNIVIYVNIIFHFFSLFFFSIVTLFVSCYHIFCFSFPSWSVTGFYSSHCCCSVSLL